MVQIWISPEAHGVLLRKKAELTEKDRRATFSEIIVERLTNEDN